MEQGERFVAAAGREYLLQPNDAVIIPQLTAHSCSGSPQGCSFWAVNFNLANLENAHAPELTQPGFSRIRGENLAGLLPGFLAGNRDPEAVRSLLGALRLAVLPSPQEAPAHPVAAEASPAVRMARAILDGPDGHETPLAELAHRSGASRFHLCRLFRRETGISPNEYRTLSRLRRARMLLSQGAPLADAAVGCGFHDQSHLTHRFRKYMGMPPGAFARACQ